MSYANVVATLAFVFAMSGGALAAERYLITSTRQISPKVLKALAGKTGPAGAQGPAGPAGPQGAAGAKGESGAPGVDGTDGAEGHAGANGISVTSKKLKEGEGGCKEGGSEFVAAEGKRTTACNGSPWTVGGTLPPGATETGVWAFGPVAAAALGSAGEVFAPISFEIPLKESLGASQVHYLQAGETSSGCKGSAESPTAEAGNLCVYEREAIELELLGLENVQQGGAGAGTAGAQVVFELKSGAKEASALGTWAVTAE